MAERIIPKTQALADRERRAVEDLRALFPDGNVTGLDSKDRALGKRLSKLFKALGYASRGQMIEALGFHQSGSKGGRSKTLDPEALLAELERRYEGKDKPATMKALMQDNPDLVGKLKSLQNRSGKLLGHTLARELGARGLLGKRAGATAKDENARAGSTRQLEPGNRAEADGKELLARIEELKRKYADLPNKEKPGTLKELKRLEPGYAAAIDALARYRDLIGTTPAFYLKNLGILRGKQAKASTARGSRTARDPRTSASKAPKPAQAPRTARTANPLYGDHVRNAGALKLLGMYRAAGVPEVLLRKDAFELSTPDAPCQGELADRLLPYGVVGIDLSIGAEFRETTFVAVDKPALAEGDTFTTHISTAKTKCSSDMFVVEVKAGRRIAFTSHAFLDENRSFVRCSRKGDDWAEYVAAGRYRLKPRAEVVSVEQAGGHTVARIRYRFTVDLSRETMLYVLHKMGVVTDEDLAGKAGHSGKQDLQPARSGKPVPSPVRTLSGAGRAAVKASNAETTFVEDDYLSGDSKPCMLRRIDTADGCYVYFSFAMTDRKIKDQYGRPVCPPGRFSREHSLIGDSSSNNDPGWYGADWCKIIAETDRAYLLLSAYPVVERAFDRWGRPVNWADCTLREWLNNKFSKSLTDKESAVILEVEHETNGVKAKDRDFPLSSGEVKRYLPDMEDRACGVDWNLRDGCYVDRKGAIHHPAFGNMWRAAFWVAKNRIELVDWGEYWNRL